jgi:hypothetical protein
MKMGQRLCEAMSIDPTNVRSAELRFTSGAPTQAVFTINVSPEVVKVLLAEIAVPFESPHSGHYGAPVDTEDATVIPSSHHTEMGDGK